MNLPAKRETHQYERSAQRGVRDTKTNRFLVYLALVGGSVLFMLPLYVMVALSLKTEDEIANSSMWSWPAHATIDNYTKLITDPELDFARKFLNTFLLASVPTIAGIVTAAMVSYPFARLRFVGRDRLFFILLATMMLPGVVTMVPNYVLMSKLGWINTYKPFIIPAFFGGGAYIIFFIRQYMMGIPRELDEAAKIDGASHAVIFWRVILPNCTPVLATFGVLGFVGGFKDFMGPLMYLSDPKMMNLEVGLRSLQTAHKTEFHLLMAGSMLVLAPIFIIFVLGQKYFARGITLSGGK